MRTFDKDGPNRSTLRITQDERGHVTRVIAFRGDTSAEFLTEDDAVAWIKQQREDRGPDQIVISPDDPGTTEAQPRLSPLTAG